MKICNLDNVNDTGTWHQHQDYQELMSNEPHNHPKKTIQTQQESI